MTPDDAKAKLDAEATLVQVVTGLIDERPGLVKRIVKGLFSRYLSPPFLLPFSGKISLRFDPDWNDSYA
ncbi:MAG TPA: hypothetical protein VI451_17065, partial [Anaerolineales bacterium]|nr:hypothetical protein [Anaerolineales bacterium]